MNSSFQTYCLQTFILSFNISHTIRLIMINKKLTMKNIMLKQFLIYLLYDNDGLKFQVALPYYNLFLNRL